MILGTVRVCTINGEAKWDVVTKPQVITAAAGTRIEFQTAEGKWMVVYPGAFPWSIEKTGGWQ